MSGRQLAGRLTQEWPGLPILFMSGSTDDPILQRGVSETGDAFIPKPISPLALTRKVRQMLDSRKAPPAIASIPVPG
jgi:CheY-like chemotaxis protein